MEFIVAVDQNMAIGCHGRMLFHVPEDLAFFRKQTTPHTLVMGRKTFESFPKQAPLPDRKNIILTRQTDYQAPGALVLHSFADLRDYLQNHLEEKVFLLGGAELYHSLLPYCQGGYMTQLEVEANQVDAYFPDLEKMVNWFEKGKVYQSEVSPIPFQVVYFKNEDIESLERLQ